MTFLGRLKRQLKPLLPAVGHGSLRVRLTVGVALVSALGLGSAATWISLTTQRLLISSQKENLEYLANRFPRDVEIYSHMASLESAAQMAIDDFSSDELLMWVKRRDGTIAARSLHLRPDSSGASLVLLSRISNTAQVERVGERYWLLCGAPLQVNQTYIGSYYVAKDITDNQVMSLLLIRSISVASVVAIAGITVATAIYIRRALQPLQQLCDFSAQISADRLDECRVPIEDAPTEVAKLASNFEDMLVRLSQSWEHQRQLVSNVSHELRTPLTIVSGYLQSTLRRGDNLTEMQRDALKTAASETERTIQLMQDLLDLARAESGRMHFQLDWLPVNPLLEDIVAMARKYSGRQIHLELPDHEVMIRADANRLRQVLLNLIDNAVKYSDPKESISLQLLSQGSLAAIEVCDRGIGIPLQQQTRIFERFYRADEARNRQGGTGLGLSIVKTFVEGMGGSVAVRSQLGKGSTFTVTFATIA